MTFLIEEDEALRNQLLGMTVNDQKSEGMGTPRQVGVWFGQPDQEIRNQAYPYITIDMVDIQKDPTREMRGLTNAAYLTPEGLAEGNEWLLDTPIPVNLDYQLTTYARHPRHDREILSQLLYNKAPFRFGVLEVPTGKTDSNNVEIMTLRRVDVLDVSKRDVTEDSKRLFVNAITVRVSSEMAQGIYRNFVPVAEVYVETPTEQRAGGTTRDPYFLGVEFIITGSNT